MILDKVLTNSSDVLHKVLNSLNAPESLLLTYLNQHCFNIYISNAFYRNLLDTKFDVFQADLGIFLALRILFNKKISKIDATAMNQVILNKLIQKKIPIIRKRVFLYIGFLYRTVTPGIDNCFKILSKL